MSDVAPLIIFSNPSGTGRLRLDKEHKAIETVLQSLSLPSESVERLHASTVEDVLHVLRRRRFSVLQFSGHGSNSGVFMEDPSRDGATLVDVEKIRLLLEAAAPHLGVAVFMSCFSAEMADALIGFVPIIILVNGPADDEASIAFVRRFYLELFERHDPQRAFKLAAFEAGNELDSVFLRRSAVNGAPRALVTHARWGAKELLIDIHAASEDAKRLGLSQDRLAALIQSRIRYHQWAFRYPRHSALFPIGMYFGAFHWENVDDVVYCKRLYKLKQEVNETLAETWAHLLICYHDCYVADYRNPYLSQPWKKKHAVEKGLETINRVFQRFFVQEATSAALRAAAPDSFLTARAIGGANLRAADEKLHGDAVESAVPHLEATLSCMHDLVDGIGEKILD